MEDTKSLYNFSTLLFTSFNIPYIKSCIRNKLFNETRQMFSMVLWYNMVLYHEIMVSTYIQVK